MTQLHATIKEGVYQARGGDLRLAERDRFTRTHLTSQGQQIYEAAVVQFEESGDEERLGAEVTRAVSAGY